MNYRLLQSSARVFFKGRIFLFGWILNLSLGLSAAALAGDLEWGGLYRIEGTSIQNTQVKKGTKNDKNYGVHHLIMRPRIVASDGLYIQGQFHILNSSVGGPQLGAVWGNSLGSGTRTDTSNSDVAAERQKEESFAVSQFYVTLLQEFGSLIAGRAPLHFGLGMTYDAGQDLFDHYYNSRDLVGYKIVMGNFYLFPMIAKVREGGLSAHGDVDETIIHLQYENPEESVSMGVMYNNRTAGVSGNDMPTEAGSVFPTGTYSVAGEYNIKNLSIYYDKSWSDQRLGIELINQTGDYGVQHTASGNSVEANAFAVAIEYDNRAREDRLNWGVKAGWASGDDPTTNDEYEGYHFNRNYDVGVLLFNHALGQENMMRSQLYGTRFNDTRNGATVDSTKSDPDIEAIGNAYYLAPQLTYKWRDKWDIRADFIAAWLDQNDFGTKSADKSLGYEVDLSLVFRPNERLVWENTFATFMPGSAFEVDGTYTVGPAYGFVSRAAIRF